MTHAVGTDLGGIHTLERLRERCRVDEDTGCWIWTGGVERGKYAAVWLPALKRRVSMSIAVCYLQTGRLPKKGEIWHSTCGDPLCASHRKPGTRSSQVRTAIALSKKPRHEAIAKMTRAVRAQSPYSDEVVEAIRASDEPMQVLADRYGMSRGYVSKIRLGMCRRPVMRGASVFSLGNR